MRERISASDPADVYARGRVAYVHDQLAILNLKIGQLGPAREHAHTAVRLNQGLVDLSLSYRAQQARAYRTLGRVETAGKGAGRRLRQLRDGGDALCRAVGRSQRRGGQSGAGGGGRRQGGGVPQVKV